MNLHRNILFSTVGIVCLWLAVPGLAGDAIDGRSALPKALETTSGESVSNSIIPPQPGLIGTDVLPAVSDSSRLRMEDQPQVLLIELWRVGVADQLKTVRAMSEDLSRTEINTLYLFVKTRPEETDYKPPGVHALKNDILNTLRRQTIPPVGLSDLLAGIYNDPKQDVVIRDYAIQHLVAWYEQGTCENAAAKSTILGVLSKAVGDQTSIAGTALLGLHRLTAVDPALDGKTIEELALNLAESNETSPAVRIAALQVCAERSVTSALPVAEVLAQKSTNIALQISAIAALGRLGGAAQADLLRRMKFEEKEPLRVATKAALKRLLQESEPSTWNRNRT